MSSLITLDARERGAAAKLERLEADIEKTIKTVLGGPEVVKKSKSFSGLGSVTGGANRRSLRRLSRCVAPPNENLEHETRLVDQVTGENNRNEN